ncbi:MAG: hypothetical protein RR721_19680 [Aeromonas sp.]|uniref:hypothetical protein n=1 Tax=Aeromonas sp. TaxID=647 RepID=UPI002FCACA85
MELCDHPSSRHQPYASQPEPAAGPLAPWYLQHRDLGWEALGATHQEHRPAWG